MQLIPPMLDPGDPNADASDTDAPQSSVQHLDPISEPEPPNSINYSDYSQFFNFDQVDLDKPLAELIRPKSLKDYTGQKHLVGPEGSINDFVRLQYLPSMILYGPPGVGKTTLASILAHETGYVFVELSATDGTLDALKQLLKMIERENNKRQLQDKDYLLVVAFIDEIHRFRINQQDFLLPLVETGQFVFIGATTVNPKLRIRKAILSRCQVYELTKLNGQDLKTILDKAILYNNVKRRVTNRQNFLHYQDDLKQHLLLMAKGDSRKLINYVQLIGLNFPEPYSGSYEPQSLSVQSCQSIPQLFEIHDNKAVALDYLKLFDHITNFSGRKPAFENTRTKTKHSGPVSSTLVGDSNDNYYRNDEPRMILKSDSEAEFKMAQQMEYSDNEYEQGGMLSDSDLDYLPIPETSVRFQAVEAINSLLCLLDKGEPPDTIVRNLLLYGVVFIKDNTLLCHIMGLVKALKNVNINITKALSNLVDKMVKAPKRTVSIAQKVKLAKHFFKRDQPQEEDSTPEIIYDEELIQQLINAPKREQGPADELSFLQVEEISSNDNLGQPMQQFDDLASDPESDSSLSSIGSQLLGTYQGTSDASFVLFSDGSSRSTQ